VVYLWSGFSFHDALSPPLCKSFNQFIDCGRIDEGVIRGMVNFSVLR